MATADERLATAMLLGLCPVQDGDFWYVTRDGEHLNSSKTHPIEQRNRYVSPERTYGFVSRDKLVMTWLEWYYNSRGGLPCELLPE